MGLEAVPKKNSGLALEAISIQLAIEYRAIKAYSTYVSLSKIDALYFALIQPQGMSSLCSLQVQVAFYPSAEQLDAALMHGSRLVAAQNKKTNEPCTHTIVICLFLGRLLSDNRSFPFSAGCEQFLLSLQ